MVRKRYQLGQVKDVNGRRRFEIHSYVVIDGMFLTGEL